MNWEYSCGAVVFTRRSGELRFVIVQEMGGAYSYPKGHMEGSETEAETARREVFEETGLRPAFIDGFRETDEYDLPDKPDTRKRVTYFLAEFGDEEPVPREGEIRAILLLTYDEALRLFPHANHRRVLEAAYAFLRQTGRATRPE